MGWTHGPQLHGTHQDHSHCLGFGSTHTLQGQQVEEEGRKEAPKARGQAPPLKTPHPQSGLEDEDNLKINVQVEGIEVEA